MARLSYHPAPAWQRPIANLQQRWAVSAGIFGAAAGVGALLFLSVTPKIKRDILINVPLLGSYYEDKTPASDKPF